MSEEFTIECPSCGTYYHHLEDEVCPFCGEPPPLTAADLYAPAEESYAGPSSEVDYPDGYPAEDYFEPPSPVPLYPPEAEPFTDEAYLTAEEQFVPDEMTAAQEALEGYYPDEYAGSYPDDAGESYYLQPEPTYADGFEAGEDYYYPPDDLYDDYGAGDVGPAEEAAPLAPRRFTFRRVLGGCLGLILCAGLFYSAIGILAVRSGLQERAMLAQTESQTRYQRGQELLAENSIELAIAEFERAVKLNPNFVEARQALREAQRISQLQPTPTSQTRTAAAADIFAQAETYIDDENWAEAVQTLAQVRDLDPDYRPDQVEAMLYAAQVALGRQQLQANQIDSALAAFEAALLERPDEPEIEAERTKAALYLRGTEPELEPQAAVRSLSQLYREDPNYLDVKQQLRQAYEAFGDALAADNEWCLAESQYAEAHKLQPDRALQAKIDDSGERCDDTSLAQIRRATPAPAPTTTGGNVGAAAAAPPATTTPPAAERPPQSSAAGSIIFSEYNRVELRWEILTVPANGGSPQLLTSDGTMPALSPNGQTLLYHSERADSVGLHALDLPTGAVVRATIFAQHVLPRWSGDNLQFIFSAQEPGTGRWQMFQGFADGKGDPAILGDGRTPDWSPDNSTIAYQGTDPEGNNPGIYLRPFGGGTATRLTMHESDRSPDFSPTGSQIAYMSTRNGNWDVYVVSSSGGEPVQVTSSPGNDGLPAWSPDGSALAFVSDRGGSWAIYTSDLSGQNVTQVTAWDVRNRANWLMAQIWWGR